VCSSDLGGVVLAGLGYGAAVGYLVVQEKALVFHPEARAVGAPDSMFVLNQRPVRYPSTDGVVLNAWVVPAAKTSAGNAMWMLICHGNLGNIGYGQRPEFYSFMRDVPLNLLAFDYRGYGESTGEPGEQGMYNDALASYNYLTQTLGVPPGRIIIFGHSLGSGVAIELASRVPAAALVVEGAYTSVTDRAQELYPMLPVRLLSTQRFESLRRIALVKMPKLFMHSPEDTVIPYAHGVRIADAALPPKRLVAVAGGHENAYRVDRDDYFGAIRQLVREVTPVGQ